MILVMREKIDEGVLVTCTQRSSVICRYCAQLFFCIALNPTSLNDEPLGSAKAEE